MATNVPTPEEEVETTNAPKMAKVKEATTQTEPEVQAETTRGITTLTWISVKRIMVLMVEVRSYLTQGLMHLIYMLR